MRLLRSPSFAPRGATLAVTLMIAAVTIMFIFAMVDTSVAHISMAYRVDTLQDAHNLAESAINQTVRYLMDDRKYGLPGETPPQGDPDPPVQVTLAGVPGGVGECSFYYDTLQGIEVPASVNNADGDGGVPGYAGYTVPTHCVQLIGVGMAGGIVSRVMEIVRLPKYDYVIATSGAFTAAGQSLVVAAMNDMPNGGENYSQADLIKLTRNGTLPPGNVTSNTRIDLNMSDQSLITGKLTSTGKVSYSAGTINVLGGVQSGAKAVDIPTFDTSDPTIGADNVVSLKSGNGQITPSPDANGNPTLTLQGFNKTGGVTVNGNIVLNNAVLNVDGDLKVTGSVIGNGAIYVHGNTTIGAGTQLAADNMVALVSTGDVTIAPDNGLTSNDNKFAGLVYTQGHFSASNVTLYGAFFGNSRGSLQLGGQQQSGQGADDQAGSISMNNAQMVQVTNLPQVQVSVPGMPNVPWQNYDIPLDSSSLSQYSGLGQNWDGSGPTVGSVSAPPGSSWHLKGFADMSQGLNNLWDSRSGQFKTGTSDVQSSLMPDSYGMAPTRYMNVECDDSNGQVTQDANGTWLSFGLPYNASSASPAQQSAIQETAALVAVPLQQQLTQVNAQLQSANPPPRPLTTIPFDRDINRFMEIGDNMRLLLERDL